METKRLLESVRRYSKLKAYTILPFSCISILSMLIFFIFLFLSVLVPIPEWLLLGSLIGTIIGLIVSVISLWSVEHVRKKSLRFFDVMDYIRLFADMHVDGTFLYYDLVALFYQTVRIEVQRDSYDEKIENITSVLNDILYEDISSGFFNKFIDSSPDGFSELCKYILTYYEQQIIEPKAKIYEKYRELHKQRLSEQCRLRNSKASFKLARTCFLAVSVISYFFSR